jgi:hypothetical protein
MADTRRATTTNGVSAISTTAAPAGEVAARPWAAPRDGAWQG